MSLENVVVQGVGMTKFGENFTQSFSDMIVEAAFEAFKDAGIEPGDIQVGYLGCAFPDVGTEGQAGNSLVEALGLRDIPVTRVSNYCASGMDAFRNAVLAVASGMYDIALAVGAEKMREVSTRDSLVASVAVHGHPEVGKGRSAPGMFALLATRYLHAYGQDRTVLAEVAVKNHANGAKNPRAHFRKEITVEQALAAPMIAYPLGLYDCCPTTDGAAAAVVVRKDKAPRRPEARVVVKGLGLSVDTGDSVFFDSAYDFLGFRVTHKAADQAYRQAGIRDPRKQIDVAEVHDCFTITEIVNYEDLGFVPRAEGWKLVKEGATRLEGELPVNPSGGLKSCGHPIGATGVRMIVEITEQLLGRSGPRQVREARVGLAHNLGGSGAVASVTVLSREG